MASGSEARSSEARRGAARSDEAKRSEAKRGDARASQRQSQRGRQSEAWLCRRSGTALGGGGEASRRSSDDEEVHGTGQTNRLALASRESAAVVTAGHRDGLENQPCARFANMRPVYPLNRSTGKVRVVMCLFFDPRLQ